MAERTGIMLAHKLTETKFSKLTKPAIVQPKFNGNRCRVIFDGNGNPTLLSSSAAEITSVNHLKPQLKALMLYNMELDGELYIHGMAHQDINGIVRRTNTVHVGARHIQYYIYDAPADHLKQYERLTVINAVGERGRELGVTHIKISPYEYVESMKQVIEALTTYVEMGYEGIIIRDLNAYYIRKKCNSMLKFKPDKSEMFKVVGYGRGESTVCEQCYNTPAVCSCGGDTNFVNVATDLLGAVECVTSEGKRFNVGGGPFLTKENRTKLWNDPDALVGRTAVVNFYEKSSDGAPKSGVLIDVR